VARQASLSGPTTRRFLPAALGATDDDEDGSIDTPLPLNKFQAASHLYRQVCRSVVSVDKSTKTRHVSPNESEESCPTTVWPCGLPLGMKQGVDGEPSHTCQRLGHEPRRAHQIPRDPAAQATPERLDHGPRRAHRSRRTLRCKQTTDLNRLDRFIVLSAAATLRREDPPSNSTTFMSRLKPSVRRLGKPLPHQLTSGVSPCQPQLPPARASSSRALVDTHHC